VSSVTLLEGLLCGATLILLLPAAVLFTEVLLALTRHANVTLKLGGRPTLAVVMPAHNESSIIADSIGSILPQLVGSDRLIVVADNCSDDTAGVAAREGAHVITRTDLSLRGKGYALDAGVRFLEPDAPDVILIIDADCHVGSGSIDRLARLCATVNRPIQALYLMYAGADAGLGKRIAEFAWIVKNRVRPEGMLRLGLPCQLMGTGMAFPWPRICSAKLATGHIVEDLKLGIELARAGAPPLFCPSALVTSHFPASREGIVGQRTRWEHGHLSVILNDAPRLFVDALTSFNADLLAMALDLIVPPVALLVLATGAVWFGSAVLYLWTKAMFPLVLTTALGTLVGLSVLFSWRKYGRDVISLRELALAIIYPLMKVPLYVRFLVARQRVWVRAKRDRNGS
jgi:cellulose synthase/poly-beta-1,6-N-acetylglucosamine synthase-like glycosyltransferase